MKIGGGLRLLMVGGSVAFICSTVRADPKASSMKAGEWEGSVVTHLPSEAGGSKANRALGTPIPIAICVSPEQARAGFVALMRDKQPNCQFADVVQSADGIHVKQICLTDKGRSDLSTFVIHESDGHVSYELTGHLPNGREIISNQDLDWTGPCR
jgi:hypothetical protein